MSKPATTTDPSVELIDVDMIEECATNPRKTLGDITELTASIEASGLLQPVLVRPHPFIANKYQLVFGWRRLRAARAAKLTAIRATVQDLTDQQVAELQLVENTQRKEVPPLEEAEGYRLLIAEHGYTVEGLALRVCKPRSWIYGRLSLTKLHKDVRKAMAAGDISESVAAVLGTVSPAELQAEALDVLLDTCALQSRPTAEEAKSIVNAEFRLQLGEAPFKKDDPDLVRKAGACTTCSKRSGDQREMFDVTSPDVCTDRVCYAAKKAASWERKSAEAEARGAKVLSEKQAGQLFAAGDELRSSEYVDLEAVHPNDPKKRTWRKLLGAELAIPEAVVQAPDGKPHELLKMATAIEAVKAVGHAKLVEPLKTKAGKDPSDVQREEWRERDAAAARARGRRDAALEEAITAAAEVAMARPLTPKAWPAVALLAVRAFSTRATLVAKRRNGTLASLETEARAGGEALARGLLVELLLTSTAADTFHAYPPIAVEALLSFGVNVKAIEKRQAADAKAAAKGPAPRALPPETKKGRRAAKAGTHASRSHPQD